MKTFEERRAFQEQFQDVVAVIVGPYLLGVALGKAYWDEVTNMMVYGRGRVSCRIRESAAYPKYRDEFTIRARTRFGNPTEIHKIAAGHGDLLLYAIANPGPGISLRVWHLIDLNVFRQHVGKHPGTHKSNGDGSALRVFSYQSFPPELVIARSEDQQLRRLGLHQATLPIDSGSSSDLFDGLDGEL